jgi:rhamnosyltransferase
MVTFHPDSGCAARLRRVLPQVDAVIVVDNGSDEPELREVREICTASAAKLVCNARNLGVARALNIGVEMAVAGGGAWSLLLDQDTEVDPDMVVRLLAIFDSTAHGGRVAAIGSRFRDPKGQGHETLALAARGEQWQEVESVITSGCLLSHDAYSLLGSFRDDFFIDYVDTEWCLRARLHGWRVLESTRPLMSHSVGSPTLHTLLWARTWTSNHPPDRRYYIARNNTVLLREYGTAGRGPWQWKSFVRCLRLCKRIVYYEHDKLPKIAAVAHGWWDGVHGRMGPRPAKIPR